MAAVISILARARAPCGVLMPDSVTPEGEHCTHWRALHATRSAAHEREHCTQARALPLLSVATIPHNETRQPRALLTNKHGVLVPLVGSLQHSPLADAPHPQRPQPQRPHPTETASPSDRVPTQPRRPPCPRPHSTSRSPAGSPSVSSTAGSPG